MKENIGLLMLLFALLSACGVPASPKSEIQPLQTSSPVISLVPSVRATSTIEDLRLESGGSPFCQVSPREAFLGSSVNVSAFHLPRNHLISIVIYDNNRTIQLPNTARTDENGYVNVDIVIPMNLSTHDWNDWKRIAVIPEGPPPQIEASCGIRTWTESSLATYTAWQATVRAPTLTVPPEQAAVTATQQALHDQMDEYCIYQSEARGFRFSPNGQWVVVYCSLDTVEIVHVDETKNWEISSDTLINPYTEYFIGVNQWSNDGAYVYIDFDPHTDGYWEPYHQGIVLYRLDLETGQISEVLPLDQSDWIFYSFAFSPNDRSLAYIVTDQSPVVLNIRDMQTGDEQSFGFESKYNTGGGFVWSPDGQKLVFSVTQFDTSTYEYIATSIYLWDRDEEKVAELIKDHQSRLRAVEWMDETKIILQAEFLDPDQIKTQNYELDLTNNELTELNP